MRRWPALFLLGCSVVALPAAAAGPYLVADLNTGRSTVGPEPAAWPGLGSVELDGFLYFLADDGMHGRELWRSDGTTEGTEMVRDVCPGPCSSEPQGLTVFGGLIGFRATDELHGHEVWVTDGTGGGTRMVKDLCPGACSSVFYGVAAVGDRLFFMASSPASGYRQRLGVTDGTAAGTRFVLEADLSGLMQMVGEIEGRLAFLGPGASHYSALWRSDGTPEGTSLALDLCAAAACQRSWSHAHVVGDRIVFWDQPYGREVWSSDGTASGTRKIADAYPPGRGDSAVWKGSLYFAGNSGFWRTDGTPEGTSLIRSSNSWDTRIRFPLPFDDRLYFIVGDAPRGVSLWQTRGVPGTTRIVTDLATKDVPPQLGPLTRVGDRVVFPMTWADRSEIWESDGLASGTRRLARLCGGGGPACQASTPAYPAALGERYLFGHADETHGFELWTIDAAGLRLVRDIQRNAGSSRFRPLSVRYGEPPLLVRDVAALGDRLVFSALTVPGGRASLWASDGTADGTREIGPGISWPRGLVRIGDRLWLRGSSFQSWDLSGHGLWSTDGTAAGTIGLAPDIGVRGLPGGRPGLVLLAGGDEQTGLEPWTSDGTPAGTGLLKDINLQRVPWPFPGDGDQPGSSEPQHFALLGGSVLFAASDGLDFGNEPWITDGTADGTRLLRDINPLFVGPGGAPEPLGSAPGPFVPLGSSAWFAADDGVSGRELWRTDGTPAGTVRVRDVRPGPGSSNPRDLVQAGTRLFFLADVGASDALWTISPQGRVTRVRLLQSGQRASRLMAVGRRLFFVVDSAETGPELWTSDGTRPGTRLVREVRPGANGSYPQELTAVDGLLLFAADDGVHGLEPWVTNGTAAGTRLLVDLAPGVDASGPANFVVAGDLVGFDADDGVHGREVWAVRKGELAK